MKTISQAYKNNIKELGKEIDSIITYTINNVDYELGNENLNSATLHYEGNILKSVMKQLDIESLTDIPIGTIVNYQFGLKVDDEEVQDYRDNYEYIDYGNFIVYSSEKLEDKNSYKIVCYDKMLYSMKDYESMNITYPITIRNYISALCSHLGLTFANSSDTFANYNREIPSELFLDSDGNSLDYTFRDVLDQLAQVTASTICINEDDELEIRYINNTNDTINAEYLKDINVNFGEVYGPINTITFKRSADADAISLSQPQDLADNLKNEIAISDNQFLNDDNRADYIGDILTQLYGLTYYINDFVSTGITYYDLCDKYNVSITKEDNEGNETTTTYSCIMFNDEIQVTQGLQENVHTDMPNESITDYNTTTKDDRASTRTSLIIDKVNNEISSIVSASEEVLILVNGKTEYELTEDTTYQEDKTYYVKNGDEYDEFRQYDNYNGDRTGNPSTLGLYEAVITSTYSLSDDTTFIESTDYYEKVNDNYVLYEGARTGNPSEMDLYEKEDTIDSYVLTEDTTFEENKAYYVQQYTIGSSIPSNTIYEQIVTPSISQQMEDLDNEIDNKLEGFNGTITNIETSVTTLQTNTYSKTQVNSIVNGTGVDGVVVSATISESGTFDKDGLLIQKEDGNNQIISDTIGRFNEKGVQVKTKDNEEIFYSGYVDDDRFNVGSRTYNNKTIVYTQNLQSPGETILGSHCLIQDYEDGSGWFVL